MSIVRTEFKIAKTAVVCMYLATTVHMLLLHMYIATKHDDGTYSDQQSVISMKLVIDCQPNMFAITNEKVTWLYIQIQRD